MDDLSLMWVKRRTKFLVAAVLTFLAMSAGIAWGVTSIARHSTPAHYVANNEIRTPIGLLGETPAEKLKAILDRVGPGAISRASIGGPPAGFDPTDGSVPTPRAFIVGKWAYFTVRAPSYSWEIIKPGWEADLVSGALRDAMHADRQTLYASRVSFELPDGTVINNGAFGAGTGKIVPQQSFPTPPRDSIDASIRDGAQSAGLRISTVQILSADQPAPAVVAESDDPASFLAQISDHIADLFGDPPRYEGYYLQVNDAAGKPFYVGAFSYRLGNGHEWIRPDLDPYNEREGGQNQPVAPKGSNPG